MNARIKLGALALALSGCATLGIETEKQKIEAACIAASGSVRVLAVANMAGKIDEDQRYMISVAVATIDPVCGADTPPTLDDVRLAAFMSAIGALQQYATKVEGP